MNIVIPKDYNHEQHVCIGSGLLVDPGLTLKLYSLFPKSQPGAITWVDHKYSLEVEIANTNIEKGCGAGFAILSPGYLNVGTWVDGNVLKNALYVAGELGLERITLEEEGTACILEIKIINHESQAWRKFLESKRADDDKVKYLENFLEGEL